MTMAASKKTDEAETREVTVTSTATTEVSGGSASRELPKARVVAADSDDPSIGWTAQMNFVMPEDEPASEGAVPPEALPTKEGLEKAGVLDKDNYLNTVVVEDADRAKAMEKVRAEKQGKAYEPKTA